MKRQLSFLLLLIALGGCRQQEPVSAYKANAAIRFDPEGVKIMQPTPGQRFTPTSSALVSFDTRTGQLCRTYAWGASGDDTGMALCDRLEDIPTETAKAP